MFGLSVMDVQQATVVMLTRDDGRGGTQPDEGGFVVMLKQPIEQKEFIKKWLRTPEQK